MTGETEDAMSLKETQRKNPLEKVYLCVKLRRIRLHYSPTRRKRGLKEEEMLYTQMDIYPGISGLEVSIEFSSNLQFKTVAILNRIFFKPAKLLL